LGFDKEESSAIIEYRPTSFSASPITVKKKQSHKVETPVEQPEAQHFTRSFMKLDGYRPKPILEE
jgi:hypothetical protein